MIEKLGNVAAVLSASDELSVAVKVSVALTIGLAAARLGRRAPAAVRHLIMASTVIVGLVLPLASALLPSMAIVVATSDTLRAPLPTQPAASRVVPAMSVTTGGGHSGVSITAALAARSIWLVGAVVAAGALATASWRLGRLRRAGLPWTEGHKLATDLASQAGVGRRIDVLLHEDIVAPMTCGILWPAILLPADAPAWEADALRRALVHELAHVRRFDWFVILAGRLLCSIYWFNPLAWMLSRRLSLEAERACDDEVVEREEVTQYAAQLVALARGMSTSRAQPALGMAHRSDLSARVSAVLDPAQPRGRAGLLHGGVVVVVSLSFVVALAPLRAVAARPVNSEATDGRVQLPRVTRMDRALVEAADDGDVGELGALLAAGANIDAAVDGDGSPLIAAARSGHLPAVAFLLDRGADVNLGVPGDGNPLIMAAREGHAAVVELLLDRGADVNLIVDGDENAIIQATGEGHLEVVKLLVARGADVNARVWVEWVYGRSGGEWRTPLSMARRGHHPQVVTFLLSSGATQ